MDSDRLACNRARWILAGTAAILIFLFAHSFRAQLKTANDVRPEAPGQGVVIRGDGLGYYAWLRSPLIDGDWEFDNEFDDYNPAPTASPHRATERPSAKGVIRGRSARPASGHRP